MMKRHVTSCLRNKENGKRIVHKKNAKQYVPISTHGIALDNSICKSERLDL